MTALAVTSITNFLLAGEVLFLAGLAARAPKERYSAAWFFSGVLLLLGVGAMLGGVDHGFFEPAGVPRYFIQRADWMVLGGMTFCLLMATAKQFFPVRWHGAALGFAAAQLAGYAVAVLLVDSFLTVIVDYAPVILLLLAMNVAGLKAGTGSGVMIAGIVVLLGASAVQALGVDAFSPVDRNGLYHLVSMAGVVLFYQGGKGFITVAVPTRA